MSTDGVRAAVAAYREQVSLAVGLLRALADKPEREIAALVMRNLTPVQQRLSALDQTLRGYSRADLILPLAFERAAEHGSPAEQDAATAEVDQVLTNPPPPRRAGFRRHHGAHGARP